MFELDEKLPNLSPKWLCHFILPPAMYGSANFSTSLSILGIVTPSTNLFLKKKKEKKREGKTEGEVGDKENKEEEREEGRGEKT